MIGLIQSNYTKSGDTNVYIQHQCGTHSLCITDLLTLADERCIPDSEQTRTQRLRSE